MYILVNNIKESHPLEARANLGEKWVSDALKNIGADIKALDFIASFEKKGEFIQIEGSLKGSVRLDCVRCLKEFPFDFDENFRVFLYQEDNTYHGDGGELELKDGDLEFALFRGDQLDLSEIIREQLLLLMPDYPLCDQNCSLDKLKTHCGRCGAVESPFSGLKGLKLGH
ncbi:MAG: DUF177 domain-containing protein [Oligoflexia bacterium]|nr:DUF177 domain-containing protein [Oligoflexia bacterium]